MPLYSLPPPPFWSSTHHIFQEQNDFSRPASESETSYNYNLTDIHRWNGTTRENIWKWTNVCARIVTSHSRTCTILNGTFVSFLYSYLLIWLPIVCVYLPLRSVCTCRPECTYTTWWSVYWYLVFIVYLVASMYLVWCTAGQCVHTT